MSSTASERIVDFALGIRLNDLPAPVVQAAKEHLLDALGVGLAAASLPLAAGLHAAGTALGRGGSSSVFGLAEPLPAPSAALVNGALIHSLEFDDTHIASVVHGSSVVVASALAMAEDAHASGCDLLRAIVLGWELLGRLGLAAPGLYQARGFQITAAGGPFAAALVASLLNGARAQEIVAALGIAGSQGSGVFEYLSDGSTVKCLHPGWAAHAGLTASLLARRGLTGPRTIFEGRFGFFQVYAGSADAAERFAQSLGTLGETWILPHAAIKEYPCCHYIHPFLEALSRMIARGLRPEATATIECEVPAGEAPIICEPWDRKQRPASGYEAKFSLPYCLAAYLVEGRLDVDTFARPADNPTALSLASRISWRPMPDSDFPRRFSARLTVTTLDGNRWGEEVRDVRGSPARPFASAEVQEKFRRNASRLLEPCVADAVIASVLSIDSSPDLGPLGTALRRPIADDAR